MLLILEFRGVDVDSAPVSFHRVDISNTVYIHTVQRPMSRIGMHLVFHVAS
jgi:hypothetical protein